MVSPAALVTGASRGIGRGIAIELARAGGRVAINYAGNAEAAAEALALVQSAGGTGFIVQGDIAVAADRERLLSATIREFGRIDLLVNNAGVAPAARADLLEAGEESFDRLFAINLKGPFFLPQLVAKQMQRQAPDCAGVRGRIVNITSISAYAASINRGAIYCMVKAGLAMMTKLFADRLAGDAIHVYEIRPGIIATDMTGGVKEKYDKLILEQGITPIRRWGHARRHRPGGPGDRRGSVSVFDGSRLRCGRWVSFASPLRPTYAGPCYARARKGLKVCLSGSWRMPASRPPNAGPAGC